MEARARATAIVDVAQLFQRTLRNAAREALAIELLVARDLDFENVGERIHDRDTHPVQTTEVS